MKYVKQGMVFSVVIFVSLFLVATGHTEGQGIPDHPHLFPYTKVLGDDYHLRLVVDHAESEILLVFEDISEKAVRVMPLKNLAAEVIFSGGDTKKVEFKAVKKKDKRTHRDAHPVTMLGKRKAGQFSYRAEWIKDSLNFDLIISFPFQGKDYKFVFDYSTGGHMFPYHMGR